MAARECHDHGVPIIGVTVRVQVEAVGGVVIAPPVPTPNGRRAVVRHPDGAVFEYAGR